MISLAKIPADRPARDAHNGPIPLDATFELRNPRIAAMPGMAATTAPIIWVLSPIR